MSFGVESVWLGRKRLRCKLWGSAPARKARAEPGRFLRFTTLVASGAFSLAWAAAAEVEESSLLRSALDATGHAGTIVVYDQQADRYIAGHKEGVDRQFIPASTFKIFSSLVALETKVVDGQETILEWDGTTRARSELNRDLSFRDAFRVSAVPHYQAVTRLIGEERMQGFVDMVGYGNRDLRGGIDSFWLTGELRIAPREQIDFLRRLYQGDLPFAPAAVAAVKEMMEVEKGDGYAIRAKTGWAALEGGRNLGWWVGWVERDQEVFFFATLLEATDPDRSFGSARLAVTRAALEGLGVLEKQ